MWKSVILNLSINKFDNEDIACAMVLGERERTSCCEVTKRSQQGCCIREEGTGMRNRQASGHIEPRRLS